MICDSMRAFQRYAALAPELWKKLTAFFDSINGTLPEVGVYELQEGVLKVNSAEAKLIPESDGKYEAHRRFIDIHIPLDGSETLLCLPDSCDLKQLSAYDEESDCCFYETAPGVKFTLEPGYFLMIFPGEPHQPQIGTPGGSLRKLVVKIDASSMK